MVIGPNFNPDKKKKKIATTEILSNSINPSAVHTSLLYLKKYP